jgi:ABC-type multidrug transport system fused ATPase/permease subunit
VPDAACRLAGVLPLDQVVVMDGGLVVEAGCPRTLAAAGGHFAGMLAAQEGGKASKKDD